MTATRRLSWRALALTGVALGSVLALALGSLPLLLGGEDHFGDHRLRAPMLIAVLAIPALLAAVGLSRTPALLAAGVVSLPLGFVSLAGATLPLLIPAAFYLVAYGRAPSVRPRLPTALMIVAVLALGAAAFVSPSLGDDARCVETVVRADGTTYERPARHSTPTRMGGGKNVRAVRCTSDVVTPPETAVSVSLVALAALGAAWMSKPLGDRGPGGDSPPPPAPAGGAPASTSS